MKLRNILTGASRKKNKFQRKPGWIPRIIGHQASRSVFPVDELVLLEGVVRDQWNRNYFRIVLVVKGTAVDFQPHLQRQHFVRVHLLDLYTESGQTFQGSFSTISKPRLATKASLGWWIFIEKDMGKGTSMKMTRKSKIYRWKFLAEIDKIQPVLQLSNRKHLI